MERLTGRKENGHAYIIGCPDFEIPKIIGMIIQRVVDKCANIEDILGDDYDLDRLRELVEADRDGRCVVYSKGFPIVSTYLQEGGLYIRETSGVIGYEEYNAALKGEQHEKH